MKYVLVLLVLLLKVPGFSQAVPSFKNSDALKFATKALQNEVLEMKPIYPDKTARGAFYKLQTKSQKSYFLYVGRINTCKASGCDISGKVDSTSFEYMDYFGLLDSTATILDLKIYNYAATHGHEVTARSWLNQFKGYNGTKMLTVDKDIDAISGATSSVYAFTYEINWMVHTFKEKILSLKE